MGDWFKASATKALLQLTNGKKYKHITCCEICLQKSMWCILFCKYRNKTYHEYVKEVTKNGR